MSGSFRLKPSDIAPRVAPPPGQAATQAIGCIAEMNIFVVNPNDMLPLRWKVHLFVRSVSI